MPDRGVSEPIWSMPSSSVLATVLEDWSMGCIAASERGPCNEGKAEMDVLNKTGCRTRTARVQNEQRQGAKRKKKKMCFWRERAGEGKDGGDEGPSKWEP